MKLHDYDINTNGINVNIHKGIIELPSCKNVSECCEVISNFVNQLDIAKYLPMAIFRELGANGKLEKHIKILTDRYYKWYSL